MPTNLAIAAVTTLGFSGILAGPALIGLVAHASSLIVAILVSRRCCSSWPRARGPRRRERA